MTKPENDSDQRKPRLIRLAKKAVKLFIVILVCFGLWHTLRNAWEELQQQQIAIRQEIDKIDAEIAQRGVGDSELRERREELLRQYPDIARVDWVFVLLASLVYALSLLPPALYFHQTLVHMHQKPRLRDSIGAHLLGHLGKYVPGKAMVVVLRSGAIAGPDVNTAIAVVAVFVETLVMMAVGGTVAGLIVMTLDVPSWIVLLAFALALSTAAPTFPPLFRLVVSRIAASRLKGSKHLSDVRIDWALILRGWCLMILLWIGIGGSFVLLIAATPGVELSQIHPQSALLATATIALAMVAGFVSLLPGGAGVRELVITTLLSTQFGLVPALVSALLARITFMFVEIVVGGILWKLNSRSAVDAN